MKTRLSQASLPGYTILKELGQGGFGTTYLVTPTGNDNLFYALKHFTFPGDDPNNYATAKRLFQREVAILRTLNGHSHIPNFIDYWEENQEYYLVQELIPGELLTEELSRGEKSEAYVIELLTEILLILRVVHGKQIIHRDINPHNIIRRSTDRQLVLIDFGAGAIQKVIKTTASTQIQTPPTRIYTLGYAPVEQIQGNAQLNSDIYALGIIGMQILTGIKPQDLQTDVNGEIIWRSQVQVSDRLANILSTMVRFDYRSRYQSVDEVLEELRKTSAGNTPTQVLTTTNNLASSQHHQIHGILLCLLVSLVAIAFLSAAGMLPLKREQGTQDQRNRVFIGGELIS